MAKVRVRVGKSSPEIARVLTQNAQESAEIRKELYLFSRKVWRYWRRIAPVGDSTGARYVENFGGPLPKHWSQTDDEAGSYRAGIVNRKGPKINGFPSRTIAATDYKSHWIEYGTGGKTPTPEFAPRQRTATRFSSLSGVTPRIGGVNRPGKKKLPRMSGVTGLGLSANPSGRRGKTSGYQPFEDSGAA